MGAKKTLSLFIVLFLCCTNLALARAGFYPPLRDARDPQFQHGLEQVLTRLGLQSAVSKNQLSVTLVDITNLAKPRLASINGDKMMYAASLPKIAILLGAYERAARGELVLDEENREQIIRMIRDSSNSAATTMLNRVGKPFLAALLQSPRYRLYDRRFNGGLWVGKEYAKTPAWKRDPLQHLSHGATAFQVARFYYLLETGRLVSPEASREMKSLLSDSGIDHKFVKGLEDSRPNARIYRKSGTWRQWHCDSAIVEHDGRRYIAVALAKHPDAGEWLSRLIVGLDDLVLRTAPKEVARPGDTP